MHHLLLPLGMFDFNIPAYMIAIVVPVAAMAFGGIIAIAAMVFKHRQREMWHETARLALEKGQPLPPPPFDLARAAFQPRTPDNSHRTDIRSGLILIAVGIGLAVFFARVHAPEAMGIGAIPGFIGVALVLFGLFSREKFPPENRPPPT